MVERTHHKKSYPEVASSYLKRERVFGPKSFRILEDRILELTGSEVTFSSVYSTIPPNTDAMKKAAKSHEKLILIPNTMLVTKKRGMPVENPEKRPITIRELFELFVDAEEASESRRRLEIARKNIYKLTPSMRELKVGNIMKSVDEVKKEFGDAVKAREAVVEKFQGGILDFSFLEDTINLKFDGENHGGWHFISNHKNDELLDIKSFALIKGGNIPTLMELIMIQLLLSTNKNATKRWFWFPTKSLTKVPVVEPKRRPLNISGRDESENYLDNSLVNGRVFVTGGNDRGVGIAALRDDIPQYRRNVLVIR